MPNPQGLAILQGYPMPNNAPSSFPLASGGGQDAYHTNNFTNTVISPGIS